MSLEAAEIVHRKIIETIKPAVGGKHGDRVTALLALNNLTQECLSVYLRPTEIHSLTREEAGDLYDEIKLTRDVLGQKS